MSDLLSLKTELSTPLLAETRNWYRDLFNLEVLAARWVLMFWMAYGVFEGLFLLDERSYSVPAIAAYAVVAVLLFLPQSNEWFSRHRA